MEPGCEGAGSKRSGKFEDVVHFLFCVEEGIETPPVTKELVRKLLHVLKGTVPVQDLVDTQTASRLLRAIGVISSSSDRSLLFEENISKRIGRILSKLIIQASEKSPAALAVVGDFLICIDNLRLAEEGTLVFYDF